MSARIVLALSSAAALLIGLTVWLCLGKSEIRSIDEFADATRDRRGERSTELSSSPSEAARAPELPAETSARKDVQENAPTSFRGGAFFISGAVTSVQDGRALALATISTFDPQQGAGALHPAEFRTDELGRFRIPNARAGRWILRCGARGFAPIERAVQVDGDVSDVNFALVPLLERPDLLVRLRAPDGRPFFDGIQGQDLDRAAMLRPVIVAACPQRGSDLPAGSTVFPIRALGVSRPGSDDWFQVTLESVPSACCCVVLGDRVLDAVPFDDTTESVVLVASREELDHCSGSVAMTVVDDESGAPLTAIIEAQPAMGSLRKVSTDAGGNARVDQLLQGEVTVRIFASMHARETRKTLIRAGGIADLGVIRLARAVSISGWIDPSKSTTLPWAARAFLVDEDKSTPVTPPILAPLGTDGEFTFSSVAPGVYVISREWGLSSSIQEVREGRQKGWAYVDARTGSVKGVRISWE